MRKKKSIPTLSTEYQATLINLGKKFEAKGASIQEAIGNIKATNVKGRAILILKAGDKSKERILQPVTASRLFSSTGLTREVFLKNSAMLFAGFDL